MKIEEKIKEIIEDVLDKNGYTLHSIYLFGSRARGDFEKESDYDILVIIKNCVDIRQKKEIWQKVYSQVHRDFPLTSFDVIIKTAGEFEEEKEIVNTISNEAYLEGVKL